MTDQLRADALGCTGNWVRTPHIDAIANAGVRFTNCVTNSPVCVPSRLSMATGLYPHNTGVWANMRHALSPQAPTWMKAVRDAGYRTSMFGKTRLHPYSGDLREREGLMHAYGLDDVDEVAGPRGSGRLLSHMTARWESKGLWEAYKKDVNQRYTERPHLVRPSTLPLEEYADVYVAQQAKKYLQTYERNQPWCCWVSFGGPHEPWDAPEPYASMYDPAAMPAPIPRQKLPRWLNNNLRAIYKQNSPDFAPGEIAAMRANYAGNVTLIDDQIGQILQVLKDRNELDNTIIVFCSDHGEMNGDHGLLYKANFFDSSLRVPLIVSTPQTRERGSAVSQTMVEWFDIGATLADLAGATFEGEQFARSLCPVLDDVNAQHRGFAVSEYQQEMLYLDHDWKMAINKNGRPYLLFDVRHDPHEQQNMVNDQSTRKLQALLQHRLAEHVARTQRSADAHGVSEANWRSMNQPKDSATLEVK